MVNLPSTYPQANQTAQPRPKLAGGATFDHVEKLCLHTTETAGWPGYPTFAPHLTYNPWTHAWHQHYALTKSATTLADPSSTPVRENRDSVIQVEIVAYCDPKLGAKYGHFIDDIDDEAVRDLAEFAAWLHLKGGLELNLAPSWIPYATSSRGGTRQRMSSSQYDAFRGILGHEHVSGNDHLDPGAPPWLDTFLRYARAAAGQQDTTPSRKALPMASGDNVKDLYNHLVKDQQLKAGVEYEVVLNEKGDKTLVFGPSDGVEAHAVIGVFAPVMTAGELVVVDGVSRPGPDVPLLDAAGKPVLVRVPVETFFRIVSYKDGTKTTPVSSRRPELPGSTADFFGTIAKLDDGRSPRLRLVINPDRDLVLKWVQTSGFALEG